MYPVILSLCPAVRPPPRRSRFHAAGRSALMPASEQPSPPIPFLFLLLLLLLLGFYFSPAPLFFLLGLLASWRFNLSPDSPIENYSQFPPCIFPFSFFAFRISKERTQSNPNEPNRCRTLEQHRLRPKIARKIGFVPPPFFRGHFHDSARFGVGFFRVNRFP